MRLSQGSELTELKVVVLGDKGCGKTCLVTRYIEGSFSSKQQSTIGGFFLTKRVLLPNGSSFRMQLWDTAGQERFKSMAKLYYRGSAAVVVCCDITSEESFFRLKNWVEEIRLNCVDSDDGPIVALACNKSDLEPQRVVSQSRITAYAQEIGSAAFLTSSKMDTGVDELFRFVSEAIWESKMKGRESSGATQEVKGLDLSPAASGGGSSAKGCC